MEDALRIIIVASSIGIVAFVLSFIVAVLVDKVWPAY